MSPRIRFTGIEHFLSNHPLLFRDLTGLWGLQAATLQPDSVPLPPNPPLHLSRVATAAQRGKGPQSAAPPEHHPPGHLSHLQAKFSRRTNIFQTHFTLRRKLDLKPVGASVFSLFCTLLPIGNQNVRTCLSAQATCPSSKPGVCTPSLEGHWMLIVQSISVTPGVAVYTPLL